MTSSGAATSSAPPPGSDKALPTTPITWAGPQGELQAAWAEAPNARGGVLVIHENKGLNDWVRSVAGRFAGIGYSALAIDLLSGQGGTAKFTDPAEATAALGKIPPEEFVANLKSGVDELPRRVPGKKLAAVGFCMGGGLTWRLLAAGEPRLAAAFPFYGPAPDNPDFRGSKDVAVLGFYGAAGPARQRHRAHREGGAGTRPGWSTSSSPNPTPTTRSSTTPATATTRPPPTTPGSGCRTG